ncbi:MAG: molybdenum cofactor guanylyltransferase [Agriterribacter sp.]
MPALHKFPLFLRMTGLVLCGGQSSRMGSDKGLLTLETKTWAQSAVDIMQTLHIPVKISVNAQQHAAYVKIFTPGQLIQDETTLTIKGPLLGVLSCHIHNPAEAIFVLACDMQLMNPIILKELYDHYLQHRGADAYVYTNDQEIEPLCAIYTSNALALVLDLYKAGKLQKHSMKWMLEQVLVSSIALKDDQKQYFKNFNAQAELNGF